MFGRRKKRSLAREMALGAAAGVVGTWALTRAFEVMQKMSGEPPPEGEREQEGEEEEQEEGVHILAERMYRMVGVEPTERQKQRLGEAIHWGYGMGWGALYGVLRHRVPQLSWGMGIPFGVVFGVLSEEVLLALTGLAPPPPQIPPRQHAQGLAAHVVYAAAADGTYRALERRFGERESVLEQAWAATLGRLA